MAAPSPPPQPARRSFRPGALVWGLLGGSVIGFAGYLIGAASAPETPRAPLAWWTLPAIIVAMLAVLAVHELGHVVAGTISRFRFVLLVVGPLRVVRELDGLHVGLNRDIALVGGIAMSVPRDGTNIYQRLALLYAGGPLASLLLALAIVGLMSLDAQWSKSARVVVAVIGAASAGIGLITLIPMAVGAFKSDGYQLRRLLTRGPGADHTRDMMLLIGQAFSGVRARDYDSRLVARVLNPASPEGGMSGLGHQYALDRGDHQTAAIWLAQMLRETPSLPRTLQPGAWLWAAIHRARIDGAPEEARGYRARADGPSLFDVAALRALADAEILAADGRASEAAAIARHELDRPRPLQPEVRDRFEQLSRH
jgi:hypothetical protein